jgi:hypothetical protein
MGRTITVFPPTRPQSAQDLLARADSALQSGIESGCLRLKPAVSVSDWRTAGAREGDLDPSATVDPPETVWPVTTTHDESADTTLEAIIARHGEERVESEAFDRLSDRCLPTTRVER